MTCIVAGVDREARKNYIACDSCISYDDEIIPTSGSKLWRCGPFILGLAGRSRDAQVFIDSLTRFFAPRGSEPIGWLVRTLEKTARKHHRIKDPDEDPATQSTMLASGLGAIFYIASDFSCAKISLPTYALGSGGQFANGALAVSRMFNVPVRDAMSCALTVARESVPGSVAPPYHFLEVGY